MPLTQLEKPRKNSDVPTSQETPKTKHEKAQEVVEKSIEKIEQAYKEGGLNQQQYSYKIASANMILQKLETNPDTTPVQAGEEVEVKVEYGMTDQAKTANEKLGFYGNHLDTKEELEIKNVEIKTKSDKL